MNEGLGARPRKVEILHAQKCVLETSEALFLHAYTVQTYTCKLPSSFNDFRKYDLRFLS